MELIFKRRTREPINVSFVTKERLRLQREQFPIIQPEPKKSKWASFEPSQIERIGSSVGYNIASGLGRFSEATEWLGRKINWSGAEKAKTFSEKMDVWKKDLVVENPNVAEKYIGAAAGMGLYYVPGAGVMKGASMISKVSPGIARLFGGSTMAAIDSAAESGSVWKENINMGKSDEEANKRAEKVFAINMVVGSITNRLGIFGDSKNLLKKVLIASPLESGQEIIQTGLSNIETDKKWDEGLLEAGKMGFVLGGVFSAGNIDIDTKETKTKIQNDLRVSPQIASKFVNVIQELQKESVKIEKVGMEDIKPRAGENFLNLLRKEPTRKMQDIVPLEKPAERIKKILKGEIKIEEPAVKEIKTLSKQEITENVAKFESELNKKYLEKADEVNQSMADIWTEMTTAEKGERFFYDPSGFVDTTVSKPSTFPDWMPSELRNRKLFDKVQGDLTKLAGDFKYPEGIRKRKLYDAILDEVDARSGVDTFNIREQLIKTYEKPKQITKAVSRSDEGRISEKPTKVSEPAPKVLDLSKGKPETVKPKEVKRKKIVEEYKKEKPTHAVSEYSKGVEAKAIENRLTEKFEGLPEHEIRNMVEQAQKAAVIVEEDYDRAIRIVFENETPPAGTNTTAFANTLEEKARRDGDVEMIRRLATSQVMADVLTKAGQEIRTAGERYKDSPIDAIQDVIAAREDAFKGDVKKEKTKVATEIKKEIKKATPTKQSWAEFINSLKC